MLGLNMLQRCAQSVSGSIDLRRCRVRSAEHGGRAQYSAVESVQLGDAVVRRLRIGVDCVMNQMTKCFLIYKLYMQTENVVHVAGIRSGAPHSELGGDSVFCACGRNAVRGVERIVGLLGRSVFIIDVLGKCDRREIVCALHSEIGKLMSIRAVFGSEYHPTGSKIRDACKRITAVSAGVNGQYAVTAIGTVSARRVIVSVAIILHIGYAAVIVRLEITCRIGQRGFVVVGGGDAAVDAVAVG